MMFRLLGCAFSSNPFRLLRKMLDVWVSTAVLMWVIIFPLFPALSVVIQKSLSIIWYSSSILITSSPRLSPSWCPGTYLKSSRASSRVQSAETPSHSTGQLPNSPAHGMNSVYYIPIHDTLSNCCFKHSNSGLLFANTNTYLSPSKGNEKWSSIPLP